MKRSTTASIGGYMWCVVAAFQIWGNDETGVYVAIICATILFTARLILKEVEERR